MDVLQEEMQNVLEIDAAAESAPVADGVFTVTVAQPTATSAGGSVDTEENTMDVDQFWPSKRMNTALTVSF